MHITGVGTAMGQFTYVYSLEIDPATGTLWGIGYEVTTGFGGDHVYTINTTTGALRGGFPVRAAYKVTAAGAKESAEVAVPAESAALASAPEPVRTTRGTT